MEGRRSRSAETEGRRRGSKERVDELAALQRLGAWHAEADTPQLGFRAHDVRAGPRVFPAADTVPILVAIAIATLRDAFAQCQTRSDEVVVATFGAYVVTAIHPFPDRNGHVALDFFRFLLQRRWGEEQVALNARRDTHELIGLAFAPIDEGPAGTTAPDHLERFEAMLKQLDRVSLAELWTNAHLVAAAHWLADGCGVAFESRLPTHGA